MATTKELRNRIKSIKNTSKITKAMELVSAAKMRRAQEQALKGRPYSELINEVLRDISSQIDPNAHPLLLRERSEKQAVLVISTNRGLCGSLNTNLFKKLFDFEGEVSFITAGKKGRVFTAKSGKNLAADFELIEKPDLDLARKIVKFLQKAYLEGEFDRVHVLYTRFNSTLNQEAVVRQILPVIDQQSWQAVVQTNQTDDLEFKFEPSADSVLETVLPHYTLMEIYQILLEASASEHSARMVAMKNASDNASEIVDGLTLVYNQLRQTNITNELLDITTASLALD